MPRIRVSTTVDGELIEKARGYREGVKDADLLDEALGLLVAQERRIEIDRALTEGYTKHPVDEPDRWGVLPEWVDAMREASQQLERAAGEVDEWQ